MLVLEQHDAFARAEQVTCRAVDKALQRSSWRQTRHAALASPLVDPMARGARSRAKLGGGRQNPAEEAAVQPAALRLVQFQHRV